MTSVATRPKADTEMLSVHRVVRECGLIRDLYLFLGRFFSTFIGSISCLWSDSANLGSCFGYQC